MTELDKATMRISAMFTLVDGTLFKKPVFSMLYEKHWRLFNSGIVEGTGVLIYYILVPLLLQIFSPVAGWDIAWFLATAIVVPVSFFSKYFIYNRWLFK